MGLISLLTFNSLSNVKFCTVYYNKSFILKCSLVLFWRWVHLLDHWSAVLTDHNLKSSLHLTLMAWWSNSFIKLHLNISKELKSLYWLTFCEHFVTDVVITLQWIHYLEFLLVENIPNNISCFSLSCPFGTTVEVEFYKIWKCHEAHVALWSAGSSMCNSWGILHIFGGVQKLDRFFSNNHRWVCWDFQCLFT